MYPQIEGIGKQVEKLEESALGGVGGRVEIDVEERERLLSSLEKKLPKSLAEELRLRFEQEIGESALRGNIRDIFNATVYRLKAEISALARRGNLNLVIGVLTTTIAVGLLSYMVMGVTNSLGTLEELLQYYVPRVSTAVFIEVFSFFFLRLYRSSLEEIRYYQDELTRLTERRIALLAAEASGDSDLLGAVVSSLAPDAELHLQAGPSPADPEDLKGLSNLLEMIARVLRTGVAGK
jgi:hypothetical protein